MTLNVDHETESTHIEVKGVGVPEDVSLGVVSSSRRDWDDETCNGVVELLMIHGAIRITLEFYAEDAEKLGYALLKHAALAKSFRCWLDEEQNQ